MSAILAWLQGISAPLQILLIVVLVLVFKDQIWEFILVRFGYSPAEEKAVAERSSKEWFDDVTSMFGKLESNHIAHLQEKLDLVHGNQKDMFGVLRKITETQRDTIEIVKDLKEYGIKCRKD